MEGIVSVEDSLLLGFGAVGALAGLALLAAGRNAARASPLSRSSNRSAQFS